MVLPLIAVGVAAALGTFKLVMDRQHAKFQGFENDAQYYLQAEGGAREAKHKFKSDLEGLANLKKGVGFQQSLGGVTISKPFTEIEATTASVMKRYQETRDTFTEQMDRSRMGYLKSKNEKGFFRGLLS